MDGLRDFPCHAGIEVLTITHLQEMLEVGLVEIVNLDKYPKIMMGKVAFSRKAFSRGKLFK